MDETRDNPMLKEVNNTRVSTAYYKFAIIKGMGRVGNFKGRIGAFHIFDNGVVAIEFEDGKSALTHISNVVLYNSDKPVEDE